METCIVYPNIMKLPKIFDKVGGIISKKTFSLPPLGILYIISNSHKKIDFIDNRIFKYSDGELYKKLKRYDAVGFGGTIMEVKQGKNVSQLLRKDGITTIYGGHNATVNWDKYIDYFDIVARGEGEITLNEILDCLENDKKLDNVLGIVYKKDGNIVQNPGRPFIADLDTLKYPAREILDLEKYLRENKPFLNSCPVDTVITSRGCPFDCTFCSSKYFWKRSYRKRKTEEVVREIEYMMDKFKTRAIYFREDLFTIPKKWVLDFCKKVKPLDIDWMCESRIDTVDEEMLKVMRDCGCKAMWFGIESCSDRTLELIRKGFTFNEVKNTVKLCKKTSIFCGGVFMFGLPYETKDDILHNFKESTKLGLDWLSFSRFIGFPKSELYDLIKKEGLDRYEYEDIIIPDTRYAHADVVTDIGWCNYPQINSYNILPYPKNIEALSDFPKAGCISGKREEK
jgi:radical SAM superfamily enzyme YgiQ (UPF0313 family)